MKNVTFFDIIGLVGNHKSPEAQPNCWSAAEKNQSNHEINTTSWYIPLFFLINSPRNSYKPNIKRLDL
jgi:hypothetical protein